MAILAGAEWAILTAFGLGVVYFIAAIPTAAAMGLHPALAAVFAWAGYVAIAAAMLGIGEPARRWIERRFRVSSEPDARKLFWRVWMRWGMPGLGLLAPVTCGPYLAALLALALRERAGRLMLWIAIGALPWCVLLAALTAAGVRILQADPPL